MALLKVKDGVQPRMINILAALANVVATVQNPPEVYITAGIDGVHSPNSLHYALQAIDIRTKNFPTQSSKGEFVKALQAELGPDYTLILESVGSPNEHLHVQYKRR